MARTITVKGIGKVSAKPDYVVLSMSLEAKNEDYNQAMELASTQLTQLSGSLTAIGFAKDAVKTTNFNVRTDYEHVKDENGNYHNKFNGFVCSHRLKLEFDFDTKQLAQALDTVAKCLAQPELTVAFTLKDPSAINKALLQNATVNAREKAELLSAASGVTLGQLLTIDYNWGELNLFSETNYSLSEDRLRQAAPMMAKSIDIEPDDININDTATFVWEIN